MRNIYSGAATTAGKRILRKTVGFAAVLCAVAIPGYCGTATGTIDFSGGGGGTIVASSSVNGLVTTGSFSVPFTQLFIAGSGVAADNGTWALTSTNLTMVAGTGSTYNFTLTGTIGNCIAGCNQAAGNLTGNFNNVVLETFTVSAMKEAASVPATTSGYSVGGTTGSSTFTMEFGPTTSLADSVALLAALGETGGTVAPFTTSALGNINGSGTTASNLFTGTASSSNDDTKVTYTTTATPEPVSFILLGTGLLGVGLISRRRAAAVRA